MNIVSSMLSNVDVPPLIGNKVAHHVKAELFKSDGTAEDETQTGASRYGGARSTNHAFPEAEGRDQKHV